MLNRGGPGGAERSDLLTRLGGLALLAVSAFVPWATTRDSGTSSEVSIAQLAISKWVFVGLMVVIVIASILEWLGTFRVVARWTVTLCSLLMLIVPLLAVVTINLVNLWAVPSLFPRSLRRLSFGVSPLIGIWLAALGAGLIVISSTGVASGFTERVGSLGRGILRRSPSAIGVIILVVGVPLLEFGRYGAWINLDSQVDQWSMPGFAIPWLGVMTLIAQLAIVLLAASCFVRPHLVSGFALVLMGWAVTIPPALILIASAGTPEFTAPSWLRNHLLHWSVQAHDLARNTPASSYVPHVPTTLTASLSAGTGTVMTYFAGALVAVAGLLICRGMSKESL